MQPPWGITVRPSGVRQPVVLDLVGDISVWSWEEEQLEHESVLI